MCVYLHGRGESTILNREIRESFTEKAAFE